MMKTDNQCPKGILCKFETIGDHWDARVEQCDLCGKRIIYNKVDGIMDDKKYLKDHLRDTVQPHGRTIKLFLQIYGSQPIKRAEELAYVRYNKLKQKVRRQELQEYRKFIWKTQAPPKHKTRTGRIKLD